MATKLGPLIIKTVNQTNKVNTGTVIFLHGSGDTGAGILDWVKFLVGEFSIPHIKFLFPTAPLQPYTPLDGEHSHVWFDRYDITPEVPEHTETLVPISEEIKKIIQKEISNGIPLNRIVIGGFSMGGALSLHMAYRFLPGFAGVFAMSSFLNNNSAVYQELKKSTGVTTPLLMFHGDRDTLVPLLWGKTSFDKLTELKVKGTFIPLKNTLHELKQDEINKLLDWVKEVIPET